MSAEKHNRAKFRRMSAAAVVRMKSWRMAMSWTGVKVTLRPGWFGAAICAGGCGSIGASDKSLRGDENESNCVFPVRLKSEILTV